MQQLLHNFSGVTKLGLLRRVVMKHFLTILFLLFFNVSGYEGIVVEDYQPYVPELSLYLNTTKTTSSFPSCGQYKHRNTFDNCPEPLHLYTSEQLRRYFAYHGYSEQDILHHESLYLSDEFVKLVKTYPHYENIIKALHDKFSNFNFVKKVVYVLFHKGYKSGLKEKIEWLYNDIQIKERFANQYCISDEQFAEYTALESRYQEISPHLSRAIKKRLRAHAEIKNGQGCVSNRSYQLSKNAGISLESNGYFAQEFMHCSGNQLQQVIHQESIDLLEKTNLLPCGSISYPHRNTLVNCVASINDYNKQGLIDQALCIADFCWTIFDYGQAVAEGVALGLYATVRDFKEHPLEVVACAIAGKQVLIYQLCKVLYNVADIGVTACFDCDKAHNKWDSYTEPLAHLISAIEEKQITIRDCIKNGSALATGFIAQGKLLKGLHSLCRTTQHAVFNFAKNNQFVDPKKYVAMPEGVLCEVTLEAERNLQTMSKPSVGNAPHDIPRIMNPSRMLLETAYAKIVPELYKEIELLRTAYKSNVRMFNGKELKIAFEHILGMEIGPKYKIQKFDISGFHHDFCLEMERSGVIKFLNKAKDKFGCYKVDLHIGEKIIPKKTFFPSNWTREKVIDKILEAYDNFRESGIKPELLSDGKYTIVGFTKEGIKIEMNIGQRGAMNTAYPLVK